ncbi:MAG: DHH family phosphoesterase [Lachnospiraceae bacterium]|nr:DHH family phosphoesterase [Lachnospiraceae bacterium]
MNNKVKISGRLKSFMMTFMWLGVLLLVINVYVYFESVSAGLVVSVFTVFYLCIVGGIQLKLSRKIMFELVSFATQYGQIQKQLLKSLDVPHAVLDENGRIIWDNSEFEKVSGSTKNFNKHISSLFPEINKERLASIHDDINENEIDIERENGEFTAKLKLIPLTEMAEHSNLLTTNGYDGYLIGLYLYDNTALKIALREIDDQSLCVALVYIDNYDEALESVEEVRRSLLTALIERKINKYMSSLDGITKKIEKDKYMVVLRKSCVTKLKEMKFDLLEDAKTVNIGNEMAVTLSIGVGVDGLSYSQNYEFARAAIDLALGRGGDQAVVKTSDSVTYYGGKSQQVEKNTRVKARVKAHALMEIISSKDQVFVMGHRMGDVDSFGASIGIWRIATALERRAHIVLDEITASMRPLVDIYQSNADYPEDMILSSARALEEIGNNAVLIIVDVNKPSITECPELFGKCKSIVVLDHHRQGSETIENATLSYVEAYASSTCEMVSEIMQYTTDNIKMKPEEADTLYSGMMVDTDNFMQKTGVRTFEAAAFLRRNGADVTRVRKLFREDANEYRVRADAVSQAEIYKDYYAISVCKTEGVASPTVVGAQAANELLNIRGIRASFVFTDYQNKIYISARSIDEVNVQIIMERMGGGGHMSVAGCQLEETTLLEAIDKLKETLDAMIEGGEL